MARGTVVYALTNKQTDDSRSVQTYFGYSTNRNKSVLCDNRASGKHALFLEGARTRLVR
ncbi:hypothetical protein J6590_049524 [Homalodisca vitripennis]|nr:hypothetical protein J6590_049524 [Homalodisca vitripennis]